MNFSSRLEIFAGAVERIAIVTGHAVAWLTLLMVLVTAVVVVLRYVFDTGWVWMQESVTWMHALVFMLGAAYTLARDEHVRVDIYYHRASRKRRAVTNILGALFLLLPMAVFIGWSSWDYVAASWAVREASRETGGLPGLFLLKTAILITAILLCLQGLAQVARSVIAFRFDNADEPGHPKPPATL